MSATSPERGDVFFARFSETIASGHIPIKPRPAVVIAVRCIKDTVVVLPATSEDGELRYRLRQPTCVVVKAGVGGLKKDSAVMVHSIREVDRRFLAPEDYWGKLPHEEIARIEEVLRELLGL
jgi:mRNA-degrading endonuclease toxin of MazEF toxin-antitoxin module